MVKVLVLSAGGIKGISILGALKDLNLDYSQIHTFIGTSVGCIINYLLILKYSPHDILQYSDLLSYSINDMDIKNVFNNYGLLSFDRVYNLLQELTLLKYDYIPSLSEFYEMTNKEFICTTYNLTKHETVYLSHHTHPDLNVLDSIKMTCNIPIVFEKIKYDDCLYIDGAVSDFFPIKYAKELCKERGVDFKEILGIMTMSCNKKPDTFLNYLIDVVSISMKSQKMCDDKEGVSIIKIDITEDIIDKMSLYKQGEKSVNSYKKHLKVSILPAETDDNFNEIFKWE